MGVYYLAVCEELRQYIDPHRVSPEQGAKAFEIMGGELAPIIAFALIYGGWPSVRMVSDTSQGDQYDEIKEDWEDVSASMTQRYRDMKG